MPYIYWDSTYILVVIGAVICMIASARVKTTFNKYSAYRSMSGMTEHSGRADFARSRNL